MLPGTHRFPEDTWAAGPIGRLRRAALQTEWHRRWTGAPVVRAKEGEVNASAGAWVVQPRVTPASQWAVFLTNRFNDNCQHQKPVKDAICSWLAGVRNTISPVTVPFLHIANLPHVSAILHFAMNQRIQFASGFIVGRDDQCPLGFSCILSARPHLDGELEGRTATFLSSMTPRSRQCANLLPPAQTLSSAEFVVSWRPSCISSLSH
jgi:hypothetical protein